jgi:hypothetical protein
MTKQILAELLWMAGALVERPLPPLPDRNQPGHKARTEETLHEALQLRQEIASLKLALQRALQSTPPKLHELLRQRLEWLSQRERRALGIWEEARALASSLGIDAAEPATTLPYVSCAPLEEAESLLSRDLLSLHLAGEELIAQAEPKYPLASPRWEEFRARELPDPALLRLSAYLDQYQHLLEALGHVQPDDLPVLVLALRVSARIDELGQLSSALEAAQQALLDAHQVERLPPTAQEQPSALLATEARVRGLLSLPRPFSLPDVLRDLFERELLRRYLHPDAIQREDAGPQEMPAVPRAPLGDPAAALSDVKAACEEVEPLFAGLDYAGRRSIQAKLETLFAKARRPIEQRIDALIEHDMAMRRYVLRAQFQPTEGPLQEHEQASLLAWYKAPARLLRLKQTLDALSVFEANQRAALSLGQGASPYASRASERARRQQANLSEGEISFEIYQFLLARPTGDLLPELRQLLDSPPRPPQLRARHL